MRALLLAVASLLPATAFSAPIGVTVNTAAGTTYDAVIPRSAISGAMMDGSTVFITNGAGGTSPTVVWADTGPTSGAAANAFWSLSLVDFSFSGTWTLTNIAVASGITGFVFDGFPGNTVFDIVLSPVLSPGSSGGRPIGDADGPAGLSLDALYSNRMTIGGVFYDDLYTRLGVNIVGGVLRVGESITFIADTDNFGVPAPAGVAHVGLALAALGLIRRRA